MHGMKITLLVLSLMAVGLAACDKNNKVEDDEKPMEIKMNMPIGLKDCKTYRVAGEHNGFFMVITRCPHGDTTSRFGKNGHTTVIDDDEEDEK